MRRLRRIIWIVGIAALVVAVVGLVRRLGTGGAPADARTDVAFDPAFHLPGLLDWAAIPRASRLTAPMGSEHAAMTYNAQPFLMNRHLGDDLNGIGGGDSDLGDPVYAIGNGRVLYAGDAEVDWGNVVILGHRMDDGRILQSFYGHLEAIYVAVGSEVVRGEEIGTVGNHEGRYRAHLHLEIRDSSVVAPGRGYWTSPLDKLAPELVLREYGDARFAGWQLNESPAALVPPDAAPDVEMQFEETE